MLMCERDGERKEEGERQREGGSRDERMTVLFISSLPLQPHSYRIIMSARWRCVLDCHWWDTAGPCLYSRLSVYVCVCLCVCVCVCVCVCMCMRVFQNFN